MHFLGQSTTLIYNINQYKDTKMMLGACFDWLTPFSMYINVYKEDKVNTHIGNAPSVLYPIIASRLQYRDACSGHV